MSDQIPWRSHLYAHIHGQVWEYESGFRPLPPSHNVAEGQPPHVPADAAGCFYSPDVSAGRYQPAAPLVSAGGQELRYTDPIPHHRSTRRPLSLAGPAGAAADPFNPRGAP